MDETSPASQSGIGKLILVPAIITLGITILRLVGELQGWTQILFGRGAGGGGSILGISWLPLILGPYFAVKLARSERGPAGLGRAIGLAVAGLVVFFLASYLAFATTLAIPIRMTAGFALMIVAAVITVMGWPALGRTLGAYGYAARIPVVIIMYFAIRGSWGTHYDALPPEYTGPSAALLRWFFIGVLPQFIFWVAYTVVVGALLGTIAAAVVHRKRPPVLAA
ncbi:MAG: hypothetical protein HY508_06580 [Acidobacteria bacterium]|nr:hypothetical protein [Acidobacteriota bacterium]